MSKILQNGAAAFLARYRGLRERLPGDLALRDAAADAFAANGLPVHRDEAWKYTSLRSLAEADFHEPLLALADGAPWPDFLPELDCTRLVFSDGHYRADLSVAPERAAFVSFAERPDFGSQADALREKMVALNTMLAEDGAVLSVAAGVDAGLLALVSAGTETHGRKVAFHPRHVIRLAPGARLTLLDYAAGEGTYLNNAVYDIDLGEGAVLDHIRIQRESVSAFHVSTLYVRAAGAASYSNTTLNLGGRMARAELHAEIAGEGAVVSINGVQLLRGQQLGDVTVAVRHAARDGTSRQVVRSVLDGSARGVFQGRIEVARGAQRSDGHQLSKTLLLSDDAEMNTKPELEIYADDVKCSHGATIGALDEDQMFYLRSRGVPAGAARAMLVRAFLAEMTDAIADDTARGLAETAVDAWWGDAA